MNILGRDGRAGKEILTESLRTHHGSDLLITKLTGKLSTEVINQVRSRIIFL